MEYDLLTILLSGVGGLTLAGGLGLLFKHLTIDHNAIDERLNRIIDLLEEMRERK